MALQIADRIKERVQTGAGTGNLTLLGAPTGFKTFSSRLSVSDTTYYCIEGPNGAFEIGVGTLSSSTTLVRTTVLRSSNSDGAISIGASGQYFVFISYIADKAVYRNIANEVVVPSEGFRFSDNTTQITSPTAAIALKADIASPTFTGTPSGPTATVGSNTTQLATTAFVSSAVANVDLSGYLPLSGGTLTGDVTAGSNSLTAAKLKLGATSSAAMFKQGTSTEAGNVPGVVVKDATDAGYMSLHARRLTVSDGLLGCWNGADWNGWVIYQNLLVGTNAGRIAWSDGSSSLAGTEDLILRRAAAAVLAQRNGLNAQCYLINKSYTSDTNQEAMMLDAGKQIAGNLGLYSYRGSVGGSNYPIKIGSLAADGTTFIGLTVGTGGALSFNTTSLGALTGTLDWETTNGSARLASNNYARFGVMSVGYNSNGQTAFMGGIGGWSNNLVLGLGYAIQMSSLNSGEPITLQAAADCQLLRGSAGPAWIAAANGGIQVRNFANSADAALTCGAIAASGDITHRFSGMIYDNLKLDQSGYSSTAVMTINGGIAGSPQIKFSPKTSNDANLIEGTGATTFQMKAQTIARLTGGSTDFYVFSGKFQMEGDGVIKNGLTATNLLLNKSYTSSSNQEGWMFDAGKQISGTLGLYSYRGSSGGSNYPIQIGMLAADGSTFSGMSVGTDGTVRTSSMLFGDTSSADYGVISATGSRFLIGRKSTSKQVFTLWANDGIFTILRGGGVYWSGSTSSSEGGGFTASVISNAAGLVEIGDGAGGAGKLNCGQLTQVPPSSLTLATNGQFSVEMTSNTAGNLVYRGSDGTTRRMALLFA